MQKQDRLCIYRAIDRCGKSHVPVRQGKVSHALCHLRPAAESLRTVRLPKSSFKSAVALLPNIKIVQLRTISATSTKKDRSIIGLGGVFVAPVRHLRLVLVLSSRGLSSFCKADRP